MRITNSNNNNQDYYYGAVSMLQALWEFTLSTLTAYFFCSFTFSSMIFLTELI